MTTPTPDGSPPSGPFLITDTTRQILADLDRPRWWQAFLKLSRVVIYENRRRLVLIPDRMSAENERDKLKREHGDKMIAANISKNGKGPTATYTCAYTLRETRTEELF